MLSDDSAQEICAQEICEIIKNWDNLELYLLIMV